MMSPESVCCGDSVSWDTRRTDGTRDGDIFLHSLATGSTTTVPGSFDHWMPPQASPDGQWIAVASRGTSHGLSLVIVDRAGNWAWEWPLEHINSFTWTPQSRLVVAWDGAEFGTGSDWEITVSGDSDFTTQSDWTVVSTVNDAGPPRQLHVAPDGRTLAFTMSGAVYLTEMSAGSQPRLVAHSEDVDLAHPVLSPDGQHLAVLAHNTPVGFFGSKDFGPLYVAPLDSGGGPVFIDPDGDFLVRKPGDPDNVWMGSALHAWTR